MVEGADQASIQKQAESLAQLLKEHIGEGS
jgi:hypothetical protein